MTVFFMLYCRNVFNPLLRLLCALIMTGALGLSGVPGMAWAGTIEPTTAKLTAGENAYVISAEFGIDLGGRLEEAVTHGVPLYFILELEITRNRWYWPSEHIAGRTLNYRLVYVPLTRQYRLSRGGALHQNFTSLDEALRMMGHVAALPVADKNVLKIGETYQVALRLALDRQQLPKPFQVDAIANKDWQIEAKVLHWQFTPTVESATAPAAVTEREPK